MEEEYHNFPVFLQEANNDCGASCLYIISLHYKLKMQYSEIKREFNFTKAGATLQDLIVVAEKIGFTTLPININLVLLKQVPLPAIIHWNNNHFVVLYKISDNKYYISNPIYGHVSFSEDKFLLSWYNQNKEGTVLLFAIK